MSRINAELNHLKRPMAGLKLDPENSRRHNARSIESIRVSLERYGQQKPIVIDGRGRIIAGNGTFTAASALGWREIAAVVFTGDATQARAYGIADNRTAELAEWDFDQLASNLEELPQGLVDAAGFADYEVAALMAHANREESEGKETGPKKRSIRILGIKAEHAQPIMDAVNEALAGLPYEARSY